MVEPAIKKTLSDLGLEYLDLYLIHWPIAYKEGNELFPKKTDGSPEFSNADYVDTWKGMEGVLNKGLTKNIGVSNFNSEQITRLLKNCKVKPVTNQVRFVCDKSIIRIHDSSIINNYEYIFFFPRSNVTHI